MADQTTLEQKRAEARAYRGVSYDDRIDRFTAAIMIGGRRQHLGSFLTAGEASLVYDQTRRAYPIERRRSGEVSTMKKLMIEFDDTAARGDDRKFLPGQFFTAQDGQRFRLEGYQLKNKRGTYLWSSRCKICGTVYDQNSPTSPRSITGFNRTCETHRGKLGQFELHEWPDPVEWGEAPKILAPKIDSVVRGVEPIPDIWRPLTKKFALEFRKQHPNATLDQIVAAHTAHTIAQGGGATSTEDKEKFKRLMSGEEQLPSARDEDRVALAVVPAQEKPNNEDLA